MKLITHIYIALLWGLGSLFLFPAQSRAEDIPTPRLNPALLSNKVPTPRLKPVRYKPVIVIDAGHGGHDPGAIGPKKTHEEDVTLKAALELRHQLLKTGRYKVVLTRNSDRYVEFNDRILIARKSGADLFISLHADSTSNKKTRGASVYTLASRAQARTYKIVSRQKWVANVDLHATSAPVSNILIDLAQRKTLSQSARFASILIPELQKSTRLLGHTHRKAGYYVLLAPDVPAVLLEMGFISNPSDEKLLKSTRHTKKLMQSVAKAINAFFKAQK